jgi:cobalt-zinc-cadmium efflux system outer membrane protein
MIDQHPKRLVALLLPALFAGCASVDPQPGFDAVRDDVARRAGAKVHWLRGGEQDKAVAATVGPLLAGELSLDAAVQVALLNNPRLQAGFEELGISQAQLAQAGTLSNPLLHLTALDVGAGSLAKLDIGLTQNLFDLFALPARKRMAEHDYQAAKLAASAAVLDLASEVKTAWLNAVAAEQASAMQDQVERATAASADLATRLHRAGNIIDLALANEQALHLESRHAAMQARAQASGTRESLTRLLGPGAQEPSWHLPERLPAPPASDAVPADVEQRALGASLDLARARAAQTRAEAAANLAGNTRFIGDLEAGWAWEREEGDWTNGPSLGVPLPLFDIGAARVAIAQGEARRARETARAIEHDIRSRTRMARDMLEVSRERWKVLDETMLPLVTRMVESSQLEYNAMQIGAFELLAAKRRQIDTGRQLIEASRDYWLARGTLDQLMQGRMAEVAMPMPAGAARMTSTSGGH